MSKDFWTRNAQNQVRQGYVAPTYTAPRPSYQERQVTDAVSKQTRTQHSTNHSNGGKK